MKPRRAPGEIERAQKSSYLVVRGSFDPIHHINASESRTNHPNQPPIFDPQIDSILDRPLVIYGSYIGDKIELNSWGFIGFLPGPLLSF